MSNTLNPFLEGQENEYSEEKFLYNKILKGIDMNYFVKLLYKVNKSQQAKEYVIHLIGTNNFRMLTYQYLSDLKKENGKVQINNYTVLENATQAKLLRSAVEEILENKEDIEKLC